MEKKVQQIIDIAVIEKELHSCPVGILALYTEKEKTIQLPTAYLYQDKNIYIFLDESSELYQSIHFEMQSSFAVIKNEKKKNGSYYSFSAIISGSIRKIDDQKVIDEIKINFLKKYNFTDEAGKSILYGNKVVIIDSEEIQAAEETGG